MSIRMTAEMRCEPGTAPQRMARGPCQPTLLGAGCGTCSLVAMAAGGGGATATGPFISIFPDAARVLVQSGLDFGRVISGTQKVGYSFEVAEAVGCTTDRRWT